MNSIICEIGKDLRAAAQLEQLESHLQSNLAGRVRDVRLMVRGDALVLQGRCQTYYAKQLAQHAVMQACSYRLLSNEIEVS
jgi:hypothetical protein